MTSIDSRVDGRAHNGKEPLHHTDLTLARSGSSKDRWLWMAARAPIASAVGSIAGPIVAVLALSVAASQMERAAQDGRADLLRQSAELSRQLIESTMNTIDKQRENWDLRERSDQTRRQLGERIVDLQGKSDELQHEILTLTADRDLLKANHEVAAASYKQLQASLSEKERAVSQLDGLIHDKDEEHRRLVTLIKMRSSLAGFWEGGPIFVDAANMEPSLAISQRISIDAATADQAAMMPAGLYVHPDDEQDPIAVDERIKEGLRDGARLLCMRYLLVADYVEGISDPAHRVLAGSHFPFCKVHYVADTQADIFELYLAAFRDDMMQSGLVEPGEKKYLHQILQELHGLIRSRPAYEVSLDRYRWVERIIDVPALLAEKKIHAKDVLLPAPTLQRALGRTEVSFCVDRSGESYSNTVVAKGLVDTAWDIDMETVSRNVRGAYPEEFTGCRTTRRSVPLRKLTFPQDEQLFQSVVAIRKVRYQIEAALTHPEFENMMRSVSPSAIVD